jgi:hypothetical protein
VPDPGRRCAGTEPLAAGSSTRSQTSFDGVGSTGTGGSSTSPASLKSSAAKLKLCDAAWGVASSPGALDSDATAVARRVGPRALSDSLLESHWPSGCTLPGSATRRACSSSSAPLRTAPDRPPPSWPCRCTPSRARVSASSCTHSSPHLIAGRTHRRMLRLRLPLFALRHEGPSR